MKTIFIFIFLIIYAVVSIDIVVNNKTLINEPAKLLATVKNGQKLFIGDLNDPERNILYLANLKGTPFEMG
jgi:hypothetical protein